MDPELREYLDKMSESLAKSHEETRSDLKAIKSMIQGQAMKLDKLSDPKSGVKELEAAHDNVVDALTTAEGTADIIPELAASAASAKPLDVDAMGVAAPVPTICSTDGLNHNADGDDHMAAWQATWSAPTPFNPPQEASPTPSLRLFVDLAIPTPTTCLIHVRDLDAGDIRVTEVPMFTPAVDWSIKQHGQVLRPMPWPSFACRSESTYGKRPYPTPPVQAALLSFWTDQALPPGRASMKIGAKVPRITEKGEKGPELSLDLELELVADVGSVGAPNAGKSTLLSIISAAKPTIANYTFTTRPQNLGVVSLDFDATMVVADLPGLLEGAHRGYGLGHEFLRHSERCSVLVQVVDGSGEQPEYEYEAVRLELELFSLSLVDKHIGSTAGTRKQELLTTETVPGAVHLMRITVLGQIVRKWKFKGTWDYAVKSTEATIKLQPTGLLCSPLPPAKTPDNHKKVILILAEMQHMITQFNGCLNYTKILSVVVLVSQSRGGNIYDPLSRFLPCSVKLSDFLLHNACPNEDRLTYHIAGTSMSKFVGLNLGNRTCYGRVLPRAATALQEQEKCCIIWEPRPPWSPPWSLPMQVTVSSSEGKYFLSDPVPRFQMAYYFGVGTITVCLTSAAANTSFIHMFAPRTPQDKDKAPTNCFNKGGVYAAYTKSSYEMKTGLHSLCAGTSRAWMVLLFQWPLSSFREFLAGPRVINWAITCTEKLCSAIGVIFSYAGPFNSSSNCEQPHNLESSDATTLTPPVQFQSPYSVGTVCLGLLCHILHSSNNQVARNSIDNGSIILVAQLFILRFLSHGSSEPDGMTDNFQELVELDACRAMPYELMLYLDRKLDISNSQLADYNSWCSLFWPRSDYHYLLIYALDMLAFDLRLYQLGISWDPEGLTFMLLYFWRVTSMQSVTSIRYGNRADKETVKPVVRFNIFRCPSREVSEMDGIVDKAEQISHMDNPIYRLAEQPLPFSEHGVDACRLENVQAAIDEYQGGYLFCDYSCDKVHKSWDLGAVTMSDSKIILSKVINKQAWGMDDMGSYTCYDQKHFRGWDVIAVPAFFRQGSVDHKYYPDFDQDDADNDYFCGAFFDWVPLSYDYYVNDTCFFYLIQVDLSHGYYCDEYHGDFGTTRDLQVPRDPGELFVATAWGQAVFQEGRGVSDLPFVRPSDSLSGPRPSPLPGQATHGLHIR